VLQGPTNLYRELRVSCGAARALRDDEDSPPERLLQAIWQHQRLKRDGLRTLEGRSLQVLHPGFWNLEGGPDFRGALVQFGDDLPIEGDIEVDLRASGWRSHNHDRNPAFKNVILHVVWQGDKPASGGPPLLELRPVLDARIGELSLWLGAETGREIPAELRGRCCGPLRQLTPQQLDELLRQAAEVRLASKASWFHARARLAGWEQSLWEGLFRALGYKHNSWAMQRVAELRPRWKSPGATPLQLQARLLGIGGLLPAEMLRADSDGSYPRALWDCWWRERYQFGDCILPRQAWRLHGLRPANHPQRRLALGAHWCADATLVSRLEKWCACDLARSELVKSLTEALQVRHDTFWNWHWTFRSTRMSKPQPLLGQTRLSDLAINVILPWLAIRASEGGNTRLLDKIRSRYFEWPAAEDNSVLKLARQRLLGSASIKPFSTAAAQQGLIQIVRDFCDNSNAICDNCKLPEVVGKMWSEQGRPG
jgi:hypothetical protein